MYCILIGCYVFMGRIFVKSLIDTCITSNPVSIKTYRLFTAVSSI